MKTLETILQLYCQQHSSIKDKLIACHDLLKDTSPHLSREIAKTIGQANKLLTDLNSIKLKKLLINFGGLAPHGMGQPHSLLSRLLRHSDTENAVLQSDRTPHL